MNVEQEIGTLKARAGTTVRYDAFPGVFIPPYHYANPVSGRRFRDGRED